MPLVLKDRVKETSTTTGTGTLTLGGAATGFQSFAVIGNGNTTYYAIFDRTSQAWEVGVGTYTSSGTTLTRDTVLESSNSGSLVNFGAGTKDVFCTYPAEKAVTLDDVQTLSNKTLASPTVSGNLAFTGTGNRITGDFSNGTVANRVGFENSVTNGNTNIPFWPNGTATQTGLVLNNANSSTANRSVLSILCNGLTDATIRSGRTGTGTYLPMTFYTGGSEKVRIDTSGNVGIGTSSPVNKLQVFQGAIASVPAAGASGHTFALGSTAYGIATGSLVAGPSYIQATRWDGTATNYSLLLNPNGGNVGIGTNNPQLPLHVQGAIRSFGTQTRTGTAGSWGTNFFNIDWTVGSTAQLWIDGTNVGTISLTSDYRIKKNIETQTKPAIDRVLQLRPVNYELADYGTLFKADGVQREGFIAHELQEVIPSAVDGEKDAPNQIQSLKLDALCAVLTKAIQEQQAIINELKARLDAANL